MLAGHNTLLSFGNIHCAAEDELEETNAIIKSLQDSSLSAVKLAHDADVLLKASSRSKRYFRMVSSSEPFKCQL